MTLNIPPTSRNCYISDIVALNIHSPQGTGDWHTAAALAGCPPLPTSVFLYGDGQLCSTNHLLGDTGVIDGTERLRLMGIVSANSPVYIADHPRACFDMLYTVVLNQGAEGSIILDDWFPSDEDKQSVYRLIDAAEPLLDVVQKKRLQQWKMRNPVS